MSGSVVKFYPKNAAEKADNVLEQALGDFEQLFIVGWDNDGLLEARASLGLKNADILWLIEAFKMKLLNGDYCEDDE